MTSKDKCVRQIGAVVIAITEQDREIIGFSSGTTAITVAKTGRSFVDDGPMKWKTNRTVFTQPAIRKRTALRATSRLSGDEDASANCQLSRK